MTRRFERDDDEIERKMIWKENRRYNPKIRYIKQETSSEDDAHPHMTKTYRGRRGPQQQR